MSGQKAIVFKNFSGYIFYRTPAVRRAEPGCREEKTRAPASPDARMRGFSPTSGQIRNETG
jgi:hypothetical protein